MNFLLRLMKGGAIGEGIQIDKLGDGSDHVGLPPAITHMMMMMMMID